MGIEAPAEERVERVHVVVVAEASERTEHLRDRRLDVLEEVRVLLHAIDEDESTRVLQLALHGDEIELTTDRRALGAEPPRFGVVVEARLDELARERLVAVAEERHEVVHARPEERVL